MSMIFKTHYLMDDVWRWTAVQRNVGTHHLFQWYKTLESRQVVYCCCYSFLLRVTQSLCFERRTKGCFWFYFYILAIPNPNPKLLQLHILQNLRSAHTRDMNNSKQLVVHCTVTRSNQTASSLAIQYCTESYYRKRNQGGEVDGEWTGLFRKWFGTVCSIQFFMNKSFLI